MMSGVAQENRMNTGVSNQQILEQAARSGDDGARIELANHLFVGHRFDSTEHERGLELLRQVAEGPRHSEAYWLLGMYFLQVTTWPDAHAEAARWLQRAADAGVAPAIDRLADMNLQGLGVPYSHERALALQQHLAECGFQQAAWQVGYLSSNGEGNGSNGGMSLTAFARACALGYPPAYYSLGLRFALGMGVTRDAAFARALLCRAADGRFPDARAAADEFAPESEYGAEASAWHRRLKENLGAAQSLLAGLVPTDVPLGTLACNPLIAKLEAHFAAIGHSALRMDGGGRLHVVSDGSGPLRAVPQAWDWLAQRPQIAVSRRFATREECAHLMHKVAGSLVPADQYRKRGANDDSELENFNGLGRPIGSLHSDAVVRQIERRIASMTNWSVAALEPCSIIRYQPGEEYRPHVDSFSRAQIERNRSERGDFGGQRIASFLLYLQVPEAGGETFFHYPELLVRGEPGMGLLHYNAIPDGSPDVQSLHSGRPVERGEKWLWRSTLREHSLYPTQARTATP